jgi:hypothetical protein
MQQAALNFTILLDKKIAAVTLFKVKRSAVKVLVKLNPS